MSKGSVPAGAAIVLCLMVTGLAVGAPPTLESVTVTPAARSLSVGQKQRYTATGMFSDGSTQELGAAIHSIAAGYEHTCVLLTSVGVDCWGINEMGQRGDGTTDDSLIPRPVKWITTATGLALGLEHTCALLASGAVQCWGRNDFGELGNGTRSHATRPVRVMGITSSTQVASGWYYSCALLASGSVRCWGHNVEGMLGDGTYSGSVIPVKVVGISSAVGLAAGDEHTCAVLASGVVRCWGRNDAGQLGDGTTTNSNVPVTAKGINNATAVVAGSLFSCALLAGGSVQCWGTNSSGVLGIGSNKGSSTVPVSVTGISTAVSITAGYQHACALLSSGSVQCWGSNYYGEIGNGSTSVWGAGTPVTAVVADEPVKLAAGSFYTCALLSDGAMRCWGKNDSGQLGDQRMTDDPNPLPVAVVGTPGVVWQSSDPTKATITMRGMAAGVSRGNTTITATTSGFINDNAVLTVQ